MTAMRTLNEGLLTMPTTDLAESIERRRRLAAAEPDPLVAMVRRAYLIEAEIELRRRTLAHGGRA